MSLGGLKCYATHELKQLTVDVQGPPMQDLLEPFPRVQEWLASVEKATEPEWSRASSFLNKVAQRGRERKAKAQQSKL